MKRFPLDVVIPDEPPRLNSIAAKELFALLMEARQEPVISPAQPDAA
ncbi:hypothetical protein ACIBHX_50600 [Nonomuraea sp. NPDC050536]